MSVKMQRRGVEVNPKQFWGERKAVGTQEMSRRHLKQSEKRKHKHVIIIISHPLPYVVCVYTGGQERERLNMVC